MGDETTERQVLKWKYNNLYETSTPAIKAELSSLKARPGSSAAS